MLYFGSPSRETLKSRHECTQALYDQVPEYMSDMLQERTNVQTLCPTVSSQSPAIPRSKLNGSGDCAFIIVPRDCGMFFQNLSLIVNLVVYLKKNTLKHICLKSTFE